MAIMTSSTRRVGDHFEPSDVDPQVQRRLRGYLEQIDYTAFASNKAVLGASIPHADAERFQRLAVAAATARGRWVAEAATMTEAAASLTDAQVARLEARVGNVRLRVRLEHRVAGTIVAAGERIRRDGSDGGTGKQVFHRESLHPFSSNQNVRR